ncbi:MAG: hypothetical protein EON86_18455 [Brevundimonas sp.]|nr:MAG: hypothetical protein EON86_18455 [Brevundimonas sp.]
MQALIELIASIVAMLATAALSQFGVDLHTPQKPEREIHRVRDCSDNASSSIVAVTGETRREC